MPSPQSSSGQSCGRGSALPPYARLVPMLAVAISIMILLGACNGPTPSVIERPRLPTAPAAFGKPVSLPAPTIGKSTKVFALEAAAAAVLANRRLKNDDAFYRDVRQEFGAKE